jgi:hypothetical protein
MLRRLDVPADHHDRGVRQRVDHDPLGSVE